MKIFIFFFGVSHVATPLPSIPNPTQATTTPKTVMTTSGTTETVKKAVKKPVVQNSVAKMIILNQVPISLPESPPDFELINTFARQVTVNIFCRVSGNELSPISGTGVIVDKSGLILTNAHVAQYLLLRDFGQKDYMQCLVRTGSPAAPKYNVEIVYISPTWISENKTLIKATDPKGTGENDFAFLRVTDSLDSTELPQSFPFIPLNIREAINPGEPVLLASYAAGFLGGISIQRDLNITTAITTVEDVFTFKTATIDLLAVPGTIVSQKGSSGGLVVDKNKTLIGIISTSSGENTTINRRLNAITISFINRALQTELGMTLSQFLSQDLESFAKDFQETNVPNLTKLITDELNK